MRMADPSPGSRLLRLAAMALLWAPLAVEARPPRLHVVEIADHRAGAPPLCPGVRLVKGGIALSGQISRAIRAGGSPAVEVVGRIRSLAEARHLVLVRAVDGCRLLVAGRRLPAPGRLDAALGRPAGVEGWRTEPDGTALVVAKPRARCRIEPGGGSCLGPAGRGRCDLRVHYYGVRKVRGTAARRRVRALQAGDAASGRFLAPGDVAEYRVQVPGPGVLIVELRGEADPQAVAVELRASDGSPLGRTRARLAGAGTVSARLTYRGTGPAAYDVRFLYNPQAPVRCALRVRPAGRGLLEATVEVVNAGRTRYPLAEPGPGTVTWRVGDEVVAGAHPGAPPPMVFLEPGERRHYTARLALPAGARPADLRASYQPNPRLTLECLRGGP